MQAFYYYGGWQVFYLKSKVDVESQQVFWAFQLVGLATQAKGYFYEFEISKGPIQKLKATEFCENDSACTDEIFKKEACAVFTFKTIRRYLDDKSHLHIRFRVLKNKPAQESDVDGVKLTQTKAVVKGGNPQANRRGMVPRDPRATQIIWDVSRLNLQANTRGAVARDPRAQGNSHRPNNVHKTGNSRKAS